MKTDRYKVQNHKNGMDLLNLTIATSDVQI